VDVLDLSKKEIDVLDEDSTGKGSAGSSEAESNQGDDLVSIHHSFIPLLVFGSVEDQ
jgi:hypothetical protein